MRTPAVRYPVAVAVSAGILGVALHFFIFAFIRIEHLGDITPPALQPVLYVLESESFDWTVIDPASLFLPDETRHPKAVLQTGLPVSEILPPFDFAPAPAEMAANPRWISSRERTAPPVAFLLQEDRNEFAKFSLPDQASLRQEKEIRLYPEVLNLENGQRTKLPPLPLPADQLPTSGEPTLTPAVFLHHAHLAPLQATPYLVNSSSLSSLDTWLSRQILSSSLLPPATTGYLQITFHP